MKKHGLYICFEGLDGIGKSTIAATVFQRLREDGRRVELVSSTAKAPSDSAAERIFRKLPFLNESRFWRFFLFAARSNAAFRRADWQAEVILGDRSIITSYIYRWTTMPFVNRVHAAMIALFEPLLPPPDVVIYCTAPSAVVRQRRDARGGCDIDENDTQAQWLDKVYHIFYTGKDGVRRLKDVQWMPLDCSGTPQALADRAYSMVLNLLSKQNERIEQT